MTSEPTPEDNSWHIFKKIQNLNSTLLNQSKKVGNTIKNTANAANKKWKKSSTLTKACIIGVPTAVTAPLLIIPALGVAGFTSAGVAAGSFAASMQTAATVSGSFFALCQSAAATGAVATSTSLGVGVGAGFTTGGLTAFIFKRKPNNPNNGGNQQIEIEEEMNSQEVRDELLISIEESPIQALVGSVATLALIN